MRSVAAGIRIAGEVFTLKNAHLQSLFRVQRGIAHFLTSGTFVSVNIIVEFKSS